MDAEPLQRVQHETDILAARHRARVLATPLGFTDSDVILIATAISEVARNMLEYAGGGELELRIVENADRRGIQIVARDRGPGIPDVSLAMQDGYSTGRSLGLGLPGAKRLMDEFHLESRVGEGTTVVMTKWVP